MGLDLVQQTLVTVLCIMQIYAVYQKSKRILMLVIAVFLLGASVSCWSIYTTSKYNHPSADPSTFLMCGRLVTDDEGMHLALAWAGALLMDTVVFLLTLYKAITGLGRSVRLLGIIFRNGTIYYSILSLANLYNVLNLRFAPPALRTSSTAITNVLSTVLISRVILNLRSESMTPPPLHLTWQKSASGAGVVVRSPFNFGTSASGRLARKRTPEQIPKDACVVPSAGLDISL
ncbi:hypothetical protein BC834DRAFT_882646, partial [Gloeopeniophorella convolvens]